MTLRRWLVLLTLGSAAWSLLRLAGASTSVTAGMVLPLVVAACIGESDGPRTTLGWRELRDAWRAFRRERRG